MYIAFLFSLVHWLPIGKILSAYLCIFLTDPNVSRRSWRLWWQPCHNIPKLCTIPSLWLLQFSVTCLDILSPVMKLAFFVAASSIGMLGIAINKCTICKERRKTATQETEDCLFEFLILMFRFLVLSKRLAWLGLSFSRKIMFRMLMLKITPPKLKFE